MQVLNGLFNCGCRMWSWRCGRSRVSTPAWRRRAGSPAGDPLARCIAVDTYDFWPAHVLLTCRQHTQHPQLITCITYCSLVLAGGYDERLPEARDYMRELRLLVDELGLAKQVHFCFRMYQSLTPSSDTKP